MSYSFTGASISPAVKTAVIQPFLNRASLVQPSLAQNLALKLQEKLTNQTSIRVVPNDGHLNFESTITQYSVDPIAFQGDASSSASQNRLTIGLTITFTNNLDPKQNWENTFTRYADFSSERNFSDIEETLITQISNQLIDDIFNKAFVNW